MYDSISICKFTDDSTLLYVGTSYKLYYFSVNKQFKTIRTMNIEIYNLDIQPISNKMLGISSTFNIIKL